MGGRYFSSNSTSTTGPIICTTRPGWPFVAGFSLGVAILSLHSSSKPLKAETLVGWKASQDNIGAKLAPNVVAGRRYLIEVKRPVNALARIGWPPRGRLYALFLNTCYDEYHHRVLVP